LFQRITFQFFPLEGLQRVGCFYVLLSPSLFFSIWILCTECVLCTIPEKNIHNRIFLLPNSESVWVKSVRVCEPPLLTCFEQVSKRLKANLHVKLILDTFGIVWTRMYSKKVLKWNRRQFSISPVLFTIDRWCFAVNKGKRNLIFLTVAKFYIKHTRITASIVPTISPNSKWFY
jgi:hypothetical protein